MSTLDIYSKRAPNEGLARIDLLLRNISSKGLKKRVKEFNDDYRNLAIKDIYERIKDVVMISIGPMRAGAFSAQEKEYFPGGIFTVREFGVRNSKTFRNQSSGRPPTIA
ncbi:hypothetical protein [Pseudomonas aeruginosa]|uniref:hypothetical protein n=1 Tax=Pseudomonas aeruginosa TaxID=287 RepID=UPI00188FDED2|nr:hypothetical protein [Pseudomonas aeruginosa]